jgi:hypothetical protein
LKKLLFYILLVISQKSFSQVDYFEYNRYSQLGYIFSKSKNSDTINLAILHLDSAVCLNIKVNPLDYLKLSVQHLELHSDSLFYDNLGHYYLMGYNEKDFTKQYPFLFKNLTVPQKEKIKEIEKEKFKHHNFSFQKKAAVIKVIIKDSFFRKFLRSKQKRNRKVKKSIEKYINKFDHLPFASEIGNDLEEAFINVVINHQIQSGEIEYANQYLSLFQDGYFYSLQHILCCLDRYSVNNGVVFTLNKNNKSQFLIESKQEYHNSKTGYKQSFGFIELYNKSSLIVPVYDFEKSNQIRELLGFPNLKMYKSYSEEEFIKAFGKFDNK